MVVKSTVPQRLRIAFYSYSFHPAVGGLEAVSLILATEFSRSGHKVKLITKTPLSGASDAEFPFEVLRRPTLGKLLAAIRWSDVYFQNNISLPALWPLLLTRKPWVVAHHTWIRAVDGRVDLSAKFKLTAIRLATESISVSQAIGSQFITPQHVIGAPFDVASFPLVCQAIPRDLDLVFVGRLVSDKGVADLLGALKLLFGKGIRPGLTIVGDGEDRISLEKLVREFGLGNQVSLTGFKHGVDLADLLRRHRVMVVPSRWEEPYGIVALEGLACGCLVVGSERGGLKDAIGPCGLTFPNGDVAALAAVLEQALFGNQSEIRPEVLAHLVQQSPENVARRYLEVLQQAVHPGRSEDANSPRYPR